MTSSFGITPQRQIRDLVAGPEKPQDLARPAEPAGIPQQIGGQLQYAASYQQDNRVATAVKGIENFLSKEGAFTTASETLFENYKLQKYNEAKALAASEANAYRDSVGIADETKALKKKGDSELARQTQLSNPWVNFFYYDTKATNAGKDISVQLGAWGKQNAEKLAEIEDPGQRSAAIAAKAQELMKPYADVPAAFQAAKIDPLVSSVSLDLKKVIQEKSYERRALTDQNTAAEKFLGPLRLGSSFVKGTFGSEQGTVFAADAIQNGYNDSRAYYVDIRGYSEKEFNALLFKEIPNLFIDKNGDGYNDIGETYSYLNFAKTLGEIKTADGQSLLSLRNAKGQTMREALEEGAVKAVKAQETFEGSVERGIQRVQREFKRNQANTSTQFYSQNPNPNDDQIVSQREAAKAEARQLAARGLLPDGMSVADAFDQIDKLYPFQSKDISPEQQARLQIEVDDLVAQGITQIPADLAARLEGTPAYGRALVAFAKAGRDAANPATQKTTDAIVRNLLGGLKGNFQSKDKQLQDAAKMGKGGDLIEKYLQPAVLQSSQRLKAEGTIYIRRKLSEAAQRGENINDPTVQLRITQDAQNFFYQRPEYSDVDAYYNITDLGKIGKPKKQPTIGSSTEDKATGKWKIDIQDADNRASFAAVARPYFANNPAAARSYLSAEFVLNEKELGEINKALATGSMAGLSQSTRRSLGNLETAFANKVSIAEIAQKQLSKFFNGNIPPSYRENALKLQAATRTPVAGTGVKPQDSLLYVYSGNHAHSGNRAVDFQIERGNRAQTANPLPSPISGIVRFSGQVQGFGNTVVIEALENGPGYRRGDRLLLGHAARLNVQTGQRVNRGQSILVAGDSSPINSAPGRSSTGTGTPGHLHSQLFRPGQGFPNQKDQYGQENQNSFVRKSLYPLFRTVNDPNRR
jgi:murein DD-endopeptidase MepM/ murein hydrolase activator NlpD